MAAALPEPHPDQKTRLGIVTVHALEGLRTAIENRRMAMEDEEDIDILALP